MAIYSPYDQVIFDDPAYLTDPEKAKEQIQEETRGIANIIARTAGPIAGLVTDPEGYQQTLDQEQRNKQILEQLGITNRQLTRDELERAKAAGYDPLTPVQALGKISGFLYSDLVKGSENIRSGVDYYDLPENERMGVAMGLIDLTDIALLPAVFKKLATIGVKKFGGKTNLKTIAQDPEIQKEFPAETQEILSITGGGFIPEGVMREADMGGSGLPIRPTGKGGQSREYIDYRNSQTNQLVDIIKQNKPEDKDLSLNELIAKYDIQEQFDKGEPGRLKLKGPVRKILKEQLGEKQYEDLYKLAMAKGRIKRAEPGTENLIKAIEDLDDESFESKTSMAMTLADKAGIDSTNILRRYKTDKNVKNMMDQFINPSDPSGRAADVFKRVFKDVNDEGLDNFFDVPLSQINPTSMAQVQDLVKRMGVQDFKSPRKLLRSFLYDRYRSQKQAKGFEDLTEEQFLKRQYSPDQIQEMKDQFDNYIDVERDRLYLQIVGRKVLDDLAQNPKYKPYLQSLSDPNKLDELIVRGNKTHDQPMFVTRVKGKGRLKKEGRLINTGTEPEFLNAHYQPYNRLQVDLDPTTSKIADVMTEKGLQEKAMKMKPQLAKDKNKKGDYIAPKDRINFVGEGILEIIKDRGFEINPSNYNNQYEFISAVEKAIQQIYKERLIRTVVPTQEGAKKTSYVFGVENPKEFTMDEKIENHTKRIIETLDNAIKNNISPEELRTGKGYMKLRKGGPVKMAMGGDPLANMNQQQFMPDPAFEGEDYFNQAVESGNLYAFNPGKIFKLFSKTDAVYTPKKLPDPVGQQQAAPPGTTLPTTQVVQPEDFAFQSFTLNKINDPQAPKAGTPEAWRQFLYGGGQGGKVPEAEMLDTGLEQYLDDYARYYPDQKITKEQLNNYYEMSPIGNIEIKVKSSRDADFAPHSPSAQDPAYKGYVGGARHKEAGSQPLDRVGTDYREIVVKAGALPGDKKPFVSSGHYEEENVLGFTRVADYLQPNGGKVSVIQEMQTDMLTKVRKEQERLNALLKRIENIKANAAREIQSGDPYREGSANRALETLNAKFPPAVEEALRKHSDLIKPFPNEAARSSIPDYQKQMMDLQKNIDEILASDLQQSKPETPFRIQDISQQQQKVLDDLLDLNRSSELEEMLKNVQVPGTSETESLLQYGTDPNVRDLETGARYMSLKNLELFPPIPFNKQADYVDLLLKSTIKDAQARGINKVAIYPPDLVNQRWGKSPDSDAGKKFRDLYGKVAIQQMKNIAKKYGGDAKVETVLNPDASDRGLTFYKTNVDGEYEFLKQDQLAQGLDPEEAQLFIDEQLNRNAHSLGSNQVIYSKEIAPGQTMDYYVQPYTTDASEKKFELIPLGPGDDRNAAQVLIEEYNPQEVQMFTITLDSDKAKGPMFMFKKKSGGSIDKDSLVSITDIFGEYGR